MYERLGGRDWGLGAPGLGQETIKQLGNQHPPWQEQPWEGVRLEPEAEQEHKHPAGWEAMVSELLLLFPALLFQPPISDTLGEART